MKKAIGVVSSLVLAVGIVAVSATSAAAASGSVVRFPTYQACVGERKIFIQDGYSVSNCIFTGRTTMYGFSWTK